jgi:hypothetical protein
VLRGRDVERPNHGESLGDDLDEILGPIGRAAHAGRSG